MSNQFIYNETVKPRSSARRRPPVIDQDGREVPEAGQGPGPDFQVFGGRGDTPLFGNLTREQRLARLEGLAKLLDVAFIIPGTNVRYGIDGLIGLVPVIGDVITTAISLWMIREARALGAPMHLITRMLGNVALDGVVGLVPVAGDAFDVMWRANVRNMRLLRKWMDKQPR